MSNTLIAEQFAPQDLPWGEMSQTGQIHELLVMISDLAKICEVQGEALCDLNERIQTLELSGEV